MEKTKLQELIDLGIVKATNQIVYEVTDYSVLEHMTGNREIGKRASKIIQSIKKNGYRPVPCLLNRNMEIIDGQARKIAFEQCNIPYRFVVEEDAGLNECITLNQATTAWKLPDYIHSFAIKGNADYIELEKLMTEYPEFSDMAIVYAASGLVDSATKSIQEGKYTTANKFIDDPSKALDFVNLMRESIKSLKGTKSKAEQALIFAYSIDEVNKDRMVTQFNALSFELKSFSTFDDWLKGISDLYNRNLKKNRIDLDIAYKLMMDKKYAWYGKKWGDRK